MSVKYDTRQHHTAKTKINSHRHTDHRPNLNTNTVHTNQQQQNSDSSSDWTRMLTDSMDLTENIDAMAKKYVDSSGFGMPLDAKTFARYLRARDNDLEKATAMLDSTLSWREDFDVANLHTWEEVMRKENETGKAYVRGHDKLNRPIVWMKPKFENTHDHDGNIKHLVYNLERAVACGEANGFEDGKICLVIDFDGYSIMNAPPMKTSMETLSILQNHYPERLAKAYLVRPPWIFNSFFSLVSPFIDAKTKDKIVMLSSNKHATLLETIDDCFLESNVGGLDSRPFDSSVYLELLESEEGVDGGGGGFSMCYWRQLQAREKQQQEGATVDA